MARSLHLGSVIPPGLVVDHIEVDPEAIDCDPMDRTFLPIVPTRSHPKRAALDPSHSRVAVAPGRAPATGSAELAAFRGEPSCL